jgi:glutathione synthase/RimK-type ligase-like ATP-grasp enzyme
MQRLVPPRGFDLRLVVAGGGIVGAIKRVAAPGEWRTNIALGGHREPVLPPSDACELALTAADAVGGDLVGVDLLPADDGSWTVIEINGAVEFTGVYSLGDEVFAAARAALLGATQRPARAELAAAAPRSA